MSDKHLKRAYAEGMRTALSEELGQDKEAGLVNFARGIPRALKGSMYGGGAGALYGAVAGEDENAILRNALTGAMVGGGVGYGTRMLSPELRGTMKWTREQLPAMRQAVGSESALRATGDVWRNVLERPGARASLAKTLKSMGGWGAGGFVGSELLERPAGVGPQPSYDQLYKYYLASAGRRGPGGY